MPKNYTDKVCEDKYNEAIKKPELFYKSGFLNWTGKISKNKTYSEKFVEMFSKSGLNQIKDISPIKREKKYLFEKTTAKKGSYNGPRKEENIAKILHKQKNIGGLGEIIDFGLHPRDWTHVLE
jgi:hypothetical protein